MMRRSVDLPLPLGPSSAVSEPSATSTLTSSSAVKSPKRFVMFCAWMVMSASLRSCAGFTMLRAMQDDARPSRASNSEVA